ncbi:ribosomal-protein-alanine N-acetyltransferase [Pullulanibacillus pueri]|uniref:Putative ribosomal-protein-alanine acetyltransferase n=1 Tax=Pullulanibacillus pueri TaxID=1437324 RepID=A0A8J2ZVH6_9BACL|nr:GNAT family protein [Pullulanibacillus pueri]MBM7682222.1 ribosomal-protein-alanine N-acetyltransferase [Pullulanibacillus pueri]GGH80508.1 putative ribosomal-protein-alanine acetyltransferase [Pullulanibacillus pueri]
MVLKGNKIYIRFFEDKDAESLLDLHVRNRELFQRYSPTFNDDYYTLDSKRKFIKGSINQREQDKGYSFGIFLRENDKLIGDVSLFNILRGALQKCLIGYSLDGQYNGRGYTTEAVSLAVNFAFNELKLHRIEAGVMLNNIGSMRVLEKVGFHKEGIEQKGVKINGQWEDHQILAIISDEH